MFEDPSMIVQSATSSFNNAAIVAPTFFWSALFMLPLFALVYAFGNTFISQLKWGALSDPKTRTFSFVCCIEIIMFAWLILMHGNYGALRDINSSLPFVISGILFVLTISIVQKLKIINPHMPKSLENIKRRKFAIWASILIIVALAGFAGMPTFWGFMMQAAAVFAGLMVGRYKKKEFNPISFTSILVFVLSTVMLMQPEFFRFGQLGNLTIIHKFFILFTSVLAVAILLLRNVKPRGKIRNGAFKKLKLLGRIIAGLSLILFIVTESVPVFLGFMAALTVLFAMSVWHSESLPEKLSSKLWAVMMCSFGIMSALPVITAFGILYWTNMHSSDLIKQSKFLL